MKHYAHVTSEVDASRGGRTTAAFFDFDGTVIAGYSVASFVQNRALSGNMTPREAYGQLVSAWEYGVNKSNFGNVLEQSIRSLKGISVAAIEETSREVYENSLSGAIYPETRALIDAHFAKGHTVVIVSSATPYQVQHVADELGIEHVLCTQLEVNDGALTGEVVPPVCYGKGKLEAANRFAEENKINLGRSFFYTDGSEDIPLLEAVGHPQPLNPDGKLTHKAEFEGWPVRRFNSRGFPDLLDIARTGLVYGGMVGSFFAAVPGWLLNKSNREFTNTAMSTWAEFASTVAGLDVRTEGEEHLWSQRPAVFIFNHQSAADTLIITRLLRRDFTGIAKKEIKSNPIVGTLFDLIGTVFIDRGDHERAIEALKPAVRSLKKGRSFAIAPEGSRSLGYKLGKFKMGAFHIAMQAGVPIVPIVIANSSDSMPKSGIIIRPARIDVKVLPPISTDDWTVDNIRQHADEIRARFLEELGQAGDDNVKLRRVK